MFIKRGAFLCFLVAVLLFVGCQEGKDTAGQEGALRIRDMMGREVVLSEPATRVVALSPSDCEILYAIGGEDTLVGRGAYCDYPAQVEDIPQVQSGYDMNLEEIIALEPQVVFMTIMAQTQEQVEALERAGIRVITLNAQDIQGVYEAISIIGQTVGCQEGADALISEMETGFASLSVEAKARAEAGNGEKTVYFETSPLEWGLWTAGTGTFLDEISTMLGLTNLFKDVEGWATISEEQVLARDPAYIVSIGGMEPDGPGSISEILHREAWADVEAIKSQQVFCMDSDMLTRPGPRLVQGARSLFALVYGASE